VIQVAKNCLVAFVCLSAVCLFNVSSAQTIEPEPPTPESVEYMLQLPADFDVGMENPVVLYWFSNRKPWLCIGDLDENDVVQNCRLARISSKILSLANENDPESRMIGVAYFSDEAKIVLLVAGDEAPDDPSAAIFVDRDKLELEASEEVRSMVGHLGAYLVGYSNEGAAYLSLDGVDEIERLDDEEQPITSLITSIEF